MVKLIRLKYVAALSTLLIVTIVLVNYMKSRHRRSLDEAELVKLVKNVRKLEEDGENPVVLGFKRKHNSVPGYLHMLTGEEIYMDDTMSYGQVEHLFYRYLEQKWIQCDNDVRLGAQHDGGWNVCMSPPFQLNKTCLIYSFGIGTDWRFEDDLFDFYGCQVMAYDPSIGLQQHNRTEGMFFFPLGIGGSNYVNKEGWSVKTFRQHLKDSGHTKTTIDYLKLDIEYTEWEVLQEILPELHLVKQLGFEIHLAPPLLKHAGYSETLTKEDFLTKFKILKKLESVGFKKFNYRLNPFGHFKSNHTGIARSLCYELHYVNWDFVELTHIKNKT